MPLVWMEVRCDAQKVMSASALYRNKGECHETWSGIFARRASDAVKGAKASGWSVVDDQWACPACAGRETPPHSPKQAV